MKITRNPLGSVHFNFWRRDDGSITLTVTTAEPHENDADHEYVVTALSDIHKYGWDKYRDK